MCEAYPPNERQKKTFVSGSEPPQASVQAGTVTGCALSTRSGQPARFQLGGRVPGGRAHGTGALQGLSAGTEELRFERVRDKFKNDAPPCPWSSD